MASADLQPILPEDRRESCRFFTGAAAEPCHGSGRAMRAWVCYGCTVYRCPYWRLAEISEQLSERYYT